jgi:coniferyl-aldehyde dehydrogenase
VPASRDPVTLGPDWCFAAQRAAQAVEADPSARLRIDRIERCIALLVSHQRPLCEAAAADFGQRPAEVTRTLDILPAVLALKHARAHLRRWMRPRRRGLSLPLLLPGTSARIEVQPLGVVGIISPWNIPIGLSFGPLASALAAGNRCLVKPSELTPATAELMRQLVDRSFDTTELAVVTGGPEVAARFTSLPFDHVLFTGSTGIGRRVMGAAAQNLVPVTLELGGKCPAIVGRSAPLHRALDRILVGKLVNAGQVCLAPDHVYLPRESVEEFAAGARAWAARCYPRLPADPGLTGIVNAQHYQRLEALLADAVSKGARVVPLGAPADSACRERRLFTPALLLDARDDMRVMQEEIFGPLLPLRAYDYVGEAVAEINRRPHALALYYFGRDASERRHVLERTRSGGVTLNDVALHYLADELPFGGVGESGMGAYHGEHGFLRFSHERGVLTQTPLDFAGLTGVRPPYGKRLALSLRALIR